MFAGGQICFYINYNILIKVFLQKLRHSLDNCDTNHCNLTHFLHIIVRLQTHLNDFPNILHNQKFINMECYIHIFDSVWITSVEKEAIFSLILKEIYETKLKEPEYYKDSMTYIIYHYIHDI